MDIFDNMQGQVDIRNTKDRHMVDIEGQVDIWKIWKNRLTYGRYEGQLDIQKILRNRWTYKQFGSIGEIM